MRGFDEDRFSIVEDFRNERGIHVQAEASGSHGIHVFGIAAREKNGAPLRWNQGKDLIEKALGISTEGGADLQQRIQNWTGSSEVRQRVAIDA